MQFMTQTFKQEKTAKISLKTATKEFFTSKFQGVPIMGI